MSGKPRKSQRRAPGRWTSVPRAACLMTLLIVLAAGNRASACPECHGAFTRSLTQAMDAMDREMAAAPMSPFSPNLAVSPDGKEVWFTLKDTGKAQVIAAEPPFATLTVLDTGPVTNHVAMVDGAEGHFAYVTVGGLDQVKVYRRNGTTPQFVTTIPTGSLPHGIWPSGDATRVYVGLENADQVRVIDTQAKRPGTRPGPPGGHRQL
jgi:DNA-binding beta-propeller fold protein YncE